MARGALLILGTNTVVATAGIIGPSNGSSCKPLWIQYISCILSRVDTDCKEYYFDYNIAIRYGLRLQVLL